MPYGKKRKNDFLKLLVSRCDNLWNTLRPSLGTLRCNGDIRAYAFGGMWVHPCGESFQEGGKDGFDNDHGDEHCRCKLCRKMSKLINDTKD